MRTIALISGGEYIRDEYEHLVHSDKFELVGVTDASMKPVLSARDVQVPFFMNYRTMLRVLKPDIVFVHELSTYFDVSQYVLSGGFTVLLNNVEPAIRPMSYLYDVAAKHQARLLMLYPMNA